MSEKVSIITPTYGREHFLRLAHQTISRQTHSNLEWLILDDSPVPSEYMKTVTDPRVRYRHTPQRAKLGRKRNELVADATGDVIVHFDDDDYYAPTYIARMLARLRGCDFVKLSGWYLYSVAYGRAGYWDLNRKTGRHHVWSPGQPPGTVRFTPQNNAFLAVNEIAYGFSYVYRRTVWEKHAFDDDVHGGEDQFFADAARGSSAFRHFRDVRGICMHILHADNTSRCFPQYSIPSFLLNRLFPRALDDYLAR